MQGAGGGGWGAEAANEKKEVLGVNIRKMKALLDEIPRGKRWISRFKEAAKKKPATRTGEGKTNLEREYTGRRA